jgi:hypothetical protein
MTLDAAAILGDPVFQLNVTLWMLQPAPPDAPIRPVLRDVGYLLSALSRELPAPVALRPGLNVLVGSDTAPAPDVLAEPPAGAPWLVIECKGSSFGPDSSTARQALKLLAVSGDLTSSLGLSTGSERPGFVTYLTRLEERDRLLDTLLELRRRLTDAGLPAGPAGALGLFRSDDGDVCVQRSSRDGDWPEPAASALEPPARIIRLDPEEDPRPLYLLPWDPSVQQDREMRAFCRSVLFARVAAETVAVLGHETVPQRAILKVESLLSSATFGVSDRWRSKRDLARTIRDCTRFLTDALSPVGEQLGLVSAVDPHRIELTVRTQADLDDAIEALIRANPLEGPAPEPENQLTLLENLD